MANSGFITNLFIVSGYFIEFKVVPEVKGISFIVQVSKKPRTKILRW